MKLSKSDRLLRKWMDFGIDYRIKTNPRFAKDYFAREEAYVERGKMELDVIAGLDFSDYFLVTSDIVRHAKDVQRQACGPGRGSAAGSLTCFGTRITEINPMSFPLMVFERFLDPGRPDYPDIDLDFADPKLIFDYAAEKYGPEYVAHIGNFNRFRGRTSVADVGSTYGVPPDEVKKLKALIVDRGDGDARENDSVEDAIDAFAEARDIVDRYPMLKYAIELEGDIKKHAMHAAGCVISNTPIEETCAVYTRENSKGESVSVVAFDKRDAEHVGMLKLDVLGLSTAAMIGDCVDMIDGLTLEDVYAMPYDDPRVLQGFVDCDLTGIFQFDGRTTRSIANQIFEQDQGKPNPDVDFMTLADINALSRPGSLISGMTAKYVSVQQGKAAPAVYHKVVNPIYSMTNGCLVYQEQVMKTGSIVGGFPDTKVGALRKIIGKKKAGGAFEEFFVAFRDGAKELHKMSEADARQLWEFMSASASYLFNVAHAVSYAVIAYWCMWFKVYHPAQFYAASLRQVQGKNDWRELQYALLQDAVSHGINVLPPNLHVSGATWEVVGDSSLRAGFTQIDGVGEAKVPLILKWREERATPPEEMTGVVDFKLLGYDWKDLQYTGPVKRKRQVPCEPYIAEVQKTRTLEDGTKEKWIDHVERDWVHEEYIAVPSSGVSGLGPARIASIIAFTESDDPFGLSAVRTSIDAVTNAILLGHIDREAPDANAIELSAKWDEKVVFVGLIKEVQIIDVVESERKRLNKTAEEVLAGMDQPNLATRARIVATDQTGEMVHVNLSRFAYPQFADDLKEIVPKRDVVYAMGISRQGFGPTVQARHVDIIDPT